MTPFRRSIPGLVLAALLLFVSAFAGAAPASAAADYTQGVTASGGGQVQFWFRPTTQAALVDVHYLVDGAGQQDFRMDNAAGTWSKTTIGLPAGTLLSYWFTYEKGGPLYDTPHFSYTVGSGGATTPPPGGGGTTPPPGGGTFPVVFQNNTRGTWADSRIYVLVLGMAAPGQWSYLKPDGTLAHINHLDETAPGHLTKNGRNYAAMSFSLAQAATVTLPAHLEGARMYLSVGSPMYIPISPDDAGWGGPDLLNPADPNSDVYFDWYEFTYQYGVIPFGGNTTQVDMFGFPVTARLEQTATGYDQSVGITLTRDQVLAQYGSTVGAAFRPLAGPYRITAPRTAAAFRPGGAQAGHLQAVIDQAWAYYSANQFTLTRLNQTFTGRVTGGRLQFTKDGTGPFYLNKPTTTDVMACSGALASAGMASTELELGAEFCAAFNRGVALNTAQWYAPGSYYPAPVAKNDYAGFFHTIGLGHRAYGFAYDDINDQSSVKILPNANPPSRLTIGIGW
ncbi:glycoside hydrolase family 64 protein [Streptomyces sp. TLI_171]|uniref:glycoside hydrolase family 64 protein n=1 Tax=Streptomyces sp. TLI_171 TaxID=1938859 RepID=UPI000C18CCA4|nr:glycoside hydrolase family 64 protein [Streptomyces sp. TLI_171]RKE23654.1 beta-1,3-glucanase [Streptomyces sp. TLI_171]